MFKYNGLSVAAEYANKQINGDRLVDAEDNFISNYYTGSGIVVQAGYLLPSNLEFAARYTTIAPEQASGRDLQDMYTLGISKYIVGHYLKIQSDFSYLLETDQFTDEQAGEFIYRFQVELAF